MSHAPNSDRLNELLADKAVFGLDAEEAEELAKLIRLSENHEDDSYEIAAAAVELSAMPLESMPPELGKKLSAQGRAAIQAGDRGSSTDEALAGYAAEEKVSLAGIDSQTMPLGRIREIVAWGTAAAVLFVAVMVWTNGRSDTKKLQNEIAKLQAANSELQNQLSPDGRKLYESLANRNGVLRWDWSPTDDSKATGDVIWDEKQQQGVMRLVNLEPNDPSESQYQLWIIEANGRKHPVDGGVFDVSRDGEVFVPINAKLLAGTPGLFAITVEKPNGVVVSSRENLPLIAKAEDEDKAGKQ